MISLRPYQRELLEHLEQEPRQRSILLSAPPGAGLNTVVARFVALSAQRGDSVVVITDRRDLVDQWVYLLADAEADDVVALTTSSDVLTELDRTELVPGLSGILVVTIQLLSQGAGRKLADALRPRILIVDGIRGLDAGLRHQLIEGLASRSESALVLANADGPGWFTPTETITWTLQDILRHSLPSVEILSYQLSHRENEVYSRALEVLREATGDLVLYPRTRPAIHASMLRLIARLSGDHLDAPENGDEEINDASQMRVRDDVQHAILQEAWSVIDSLEELGHDGRLEATDALVERAAREGRLCVVITELVAEADYVASYLKDNGIQVVLLTAENSPAQWRQLQETLTEKSVLVVSNAAGTAFDLLSNVRQRTQIVWWSTPRTVSQLRRWLTLVSRARQATVIAITAPALPGEQDLQTIIDALDNE